MKSKLRADNEWGEGPSPGADFSADVSFGSFSTELSYPDDVRFTPDSDATADIPVRQPRANSGHFNLCVRQVLTL
jgi:hypothetical protein